MSPKGGYREGSGRKPWLSPEDLTKQYTVWLTDRQAEIAREHGDGELSAGVRNLLDAQHREGEKE